MTQDGETVRHIKILLVVGDMEVYLITDFDTLNIVRGKVTANCGHVYMYLFAISYHFGTISGCYGIGVLVLIQSIDFL